MPENQSPSINFQWGGLFNSFARSKIPDGRCWRMANASVDLGILQARPGFGQIGRRPSTPEAWINTDICYGMGYGRYGTSEKYIFLIRPKPATYSAAYLYVYDPNTETWTTFGSDDNWNHRVTTRWMFTTWNQYIFGVNETDGLWKYDVTSILATAWTKVELKLSSIVSPTSSVSLNRPDYGIRKWATGTDTVVVHAPDYYAPGGGVGGSPSSASNTCTIDNNTGTWTSIQAVNGSAIAYATAWFVCRTDIDFSTQRNISFVVTVNSLDVDPATGPGATPWGDVRPHEEPWLNPSGAFKCYVSDDVAEVVGTWTAWGDARITKEFITTSPAQGMSSRYIEAIVTVDLDSIAESNSHDLTTIKSIAIGVPVVSGNDYSVTLSPLTLGGNFLSKPDTGSYLYKGGADPYNYYKTTLKDLVYRVQFYKHTATIAESAATEYTLSAKDSVGINSGGTVLMPLGAQTKITLPVPTGSYTKTRLWRKRHSDSGKWYLIEEIAAASLPATVTDARVDDVNDPIDWAEVTTRDSGATFGTSTIDEIPATCATSWKSHFVLGSGTKVYLSKAFDETQYYYPLDDPNSPNSGAVDTSDQTLGRTLYMSNDKSETVTNLVAQDHLYAVGPRHVYVMIGDRAIDATPFRKLPGSKGSLGPRAVCAYKDGILVGSRAGLYFYQASRAFASSNDSSTYQEEEMTKECRVSWNALVLGDPDNDLIVREFEDQILCIRGSNYMRLTRNGRWEEGTFSEDALHDGDSGGGDGDGGDGVDIGPGDGTDDITPAEEDPIDGGTEICYSNPALFTITYSWSGTSSGATTPTDWSLPTTTASHTAAKFVGTSSSGTLTASGTLTITITYTGGNPKPTYVYVTVTSNCLASATSPDYTTGYQSTVSVAISDGLGTSTYYGTNVQNSKDIHAEGTRTYRLKANSSGVATLALSVSGSASATTSQYALDGAELLIEAAHSAEIAECGSPITRPA